MPWISTPVTFTLQTRARMYNECQATITLKIQIPIQSPRPHSKVFNRASPHRPTRFQNISTLVAHSSSSTRSFENLPL